VVRFAQLWRPRRAPDLAPRKITYGDALTMNFYGTSARPHYPKLGLRLAPRPAPWVVVVHAGGWNGGSPEQLGELNRVLAAEGYAVAAVSYRLAPEWKWPAQRDDVMAAVRYLKTHSAELGLDPEKWAVLGRSAGGQIAEAVAYGDAPSGLRGCIAFYAPADLNFAFKYAAERGDIIRSKKLMIDLLGGTPAELKDAYNDASPYTKAGKDSPPTLLLHGANDALTWRKQSQRLQEKLQRAGAPAALILLPWATHGFDYTLNGPGGQISTYAVKGFLKSVFADAR